MRICLASAHPYLPQIAGGSQSNTHELAHELIARGHEVSVLAGLTKDGMIGMRNRFLLKLGASAPSDAGLGYPVFRTWFAWEGAAELVRKARPQVAVVQSGSIVCLARAFADLGVPTVLYLHNVEYEDHGGPIEEFADGLFLANSDFTAERYHRDHGVRSEVLNPLFQPERYAVESSRQSIVFINPHPLKGVDLALEIAAACPEIPFTFVESWTLDEDFRTALIQRIAALPNVTLQPRTRDMRGVYGEAKLVIVPSQWEETWGRVASEAHYSGIPVVATCMGGLPEAVGPGGVLMDPDDNAAAWAATLRSIWNDAARYESLAQAARDYAHRPQIDRERQLDHFEDVLRRAVEREAV